MKTFQDTEALFIDFVGNWNAMAPLLYANRGQRSDFVAPPFTTSPMIFNLKCALDNLGSTQELKTAAKSCRAKVRKHTLDGGRIQAVLYQPLLRQSYVADALYLKIEERLKLHHGDVQWDLPSCQAMKESLLAARGTAATIAVKTWTGSWTTSSRMHEPF